MFAIHKFHTSLKALNCVGSRKKLLEPGFARFCHLFQKFKLPLRGCKVGDAERDRAGIALQAMWNVRCMRIIREF